MGVTDYLKPAYWCNTNCVRFYSRHGMNIRRVILGLLAVSLLLMFCWELTGEGKGAELACSTIKRTNSLGRWPTLGVYAGGMLLTGMLASFAFWPGMVATSTQASIDQYTSQYSGLGPRK